MHLNQVFFIFGCPQTTINHFNISYESFQEIFWFGQ